MKILRTLAVAGIAKKLFDEARKPQNQARIRAAVDDAKAKRARKH